MCGCNVAVGSTPTPLQRKRRGGMVDREALRPALCFVRGDHAAPPGKLSIPGYLPACGPCHVAAAFPNDVDTPASATTMLPPGCQWALPMFPAAANVHLPFTMCEGLEGFTKASLHQILSQCFGDSNILEEDTVKQRGFVVVPQGSAGERLRNIQGSSYIWAKGMHAAIVRVVSYTLHANATYVSPSPHRRNRQKTPHVVPKHVCHETFEGPLDFSQNQ